MMSRLRGKPGESSEPTDTAPSEHWKLPMSLRRHPR
jgi:hypothetical protein